MPFSHNPKTPGDLLESQDWNVALDAIVDLFAKFQNGAAGHGHSGVGEDAPQIATTGLVDAAVTDNKLAANAVTASKIASNAIAGSKIQSNAISTNKIANGAITAAKLAAGVAADIGISVTSAIASGSQIPVPSGFLRSECVFFATVKLLDKSGGGSNFNYNFSINSDGTITTNNSSNLTVTFSAIAFGKKGGW